LISQDWLHDGEDVDSLAVDGACLKLPQSNAVDGFHPTKADCEIVVGTSDGRIVQLIQASHIKNQLVPERSINQHVWPISGGSLHIFQVHGGGTYVIALGVRAGSMQAFNAQLGTFVGEWILPGGISWMTVCVGGDNVYVLGRRNVSMTEVDRFPVPDKLMRRADSNMSLRLSTSTQYVAHGQEV